MKMQELKNKLKENKLDDFFDSRFNSYKEIAPFSYTSIYNAKNSGLKAKCKYKDALGNAYNAYGLYIFYNSESNDIKYIGEAAREPFSKRLSQHFNNSHGGLRKRYPDKISVIEECEILILYQEKSKKDSKQIHFDEDLLIGIFKPELNNR